MNRDLSVGKPSSVMLKFCLPLFGSMIFQQLYNIADSFVAGKFIGEDALAAVGNSYEVTLIFIAFAFGCNIGCSVIVSQLFGAKRINEVKTAVYTAFIATGIVCLTLMTLGIAFCGMLLRLISTPANVFGDSELYLKIYIWSLPFVFYYNVATGIFSALGDSKTPFWFLTVSSLSNIGMDILFVTVFKMGVSGVAWATFICQGVSCILAVIFVFKRFSSLESESGDDERVRIFSWKLLSRIVMIAVPSILQQSFISVGNIVIQRIINGFGSSVMAGYSASVKLNNLVITSLSTLGTGVSNYTAQNLGAGKPERVNEGFYAGVKLVFFICVPFTILYLTAGRLLMHFFLDNPSETALSSGNMFLRIISPFYLLVSGKIVADGILRGSNNMSRFMISTFTDLILRVILAFILSKQFGTTGIWMAWPIGWCIATVISVAFYYSKRKKFRL